MFYDLSLPCCRCHQKQEADGQCSISSHILPACVPVTVSLTGGEVSAYLFEESGDHGFQRTIGLHSKPELLCNSSTIEFRLGKSGLKCIQYILSRVHSGIHSVHEHLFLRFCSFIQVVICSHQLELCVLLGQRVSCQHQHPRSEHSLCESPPPPNYPKHMIKSSY